MKLWPLSIDLTEAALRDNKGRFVDVLDVHDRTVARVFAIDDDYGHAGEMVDRINNWPSAIEELRRLAVIPTQAKGLQNRVVHDGSLCRVCHGTWKLNLPEFHATTCPLKGTTP